MNNLTSEKVNRSVYDNKFICSEEGPDLLLRKEVLAEVHIYSKELAQYMHGIKIWTATKQMDYRCTYVRFKNYKKYMLGNFIGMNEYELGHPQVKIYIYITCKKNDMLTTHVKNIFAVPFALDQCQEITFGFLNIYSVNQLLSKISLKHTDHNIYLLHNSEVIETFMVYDTKDDHDSYRFLVGCCNSCSTDIVGSSSIDNIKEIYCR